MSWPLAGTSGILSDGNGGRRLVGEVRMVGSGGGGSVGVEGTQVFEAIMPQQRTG